MLFLVYAESANYGGYGEHYVVEALSEEEAHDLVEDEAESYFRDQDYDSLVEDHGEEDADNMAYSHIVSIEEFTESHKDWKYKEEFNYI